MTDISKRLVIAISSRALFDLTESNRIYEEEGVDAFAKYQIAHENDILAPGVAFNLVKKLLNLNQYGDIVEVILLSRNSADTGLRVFNSIEQYQLSITRAAFTGGKDTYHYIKAFNTHLFLSANATDVVNSINAGYAAATILSSSTGNKEDPQLRIAFDGDAVLFSDEAERVYQESGLASFTEHEKAAATTPLAGGPFKDFLEKLHQVQSLLPKDECPIRTALVTARSAPAHERVIRTFRDWDIRIDEALFLGGLDKGDFLKAFRADIFFDDQQQHCDTARQHVATGHVPFGVKN